MRVTPHGRAVYSVASGVRGARDGPRDRPTGGPSSAWRTQTASGSLAGGHLDTPDVVGRHLRRLDRLEPTDKC
jgi:hypothetical protein